MVRFVTLIVLIVFALIVIAVVLFGLSAVFQMGVGAVESATNPHIPQDTMQEYALVQENLSHVQAAIYGVASNVTGGNFSQAEARISGAVANVTRG